jgi:GNAT superfamily N-acetyltransferase
MRLTVSKVPAEGIIITRWKRGTCVGRAYLYLMRNKLHDEPFGFMEDVYVDESCRGQGIGEALVKRVIAEAKKRGCYKLVATSRQERPKVHDLYLKLGFADRGKEFRIDFEKTP